MPGRTALIVERWSEASLGLVAGVSLFAMMILTFVDVVGRYFFSAPVLGAMEIVEVLLVLTIFAGLPLSALRQGHIEIDVLATWIPAGLWTLLGRLGNLVFAGALVYTAWLLVLRARILAQDGEVTAILHIPVLAVAWSMAALSLVAALLHLFRAIQPRTEPAPIEGADIVGEP